MEEDKYFENKTNKELVANALATVSVYKKDTLKAQADHDDSKKVIDEKMDEILGLKESIAT